MASEKNLQELFHDTLKDIYFAEKKILVGLAENGEGGAVQGSQSRLPKARDRNRRARSATRKGVRGNRRSARAARPAMPSWASSRRARK